MAVTETRSAPLFEQFMAYRGFGGTLAFGHDGAHVYFVSNISGQFNLWRVPADGGWPEQLTAFTEQTVRLIAVSPVDGTVALCADRDGDEFHQLYLLDPDRGWLHSKGEYTLVNRTRDTLSQVALSGGSHWRKLHWTMNGDSARPEDRARLHVFALAPPLAPGDRVCIGFKFEGRYPDGTSRKRAGAGEYVLPSGVDDFPMPVHWTVVVYLGMPILDNCDLEAASEAAHARKRWEFLLTVAPLFVGGGTGSPINPLATF